jgi:azurin
MKRLCLVAVLAMCTPVAVSQLSAQATTPAPAGAKPAAPAGAKPAAQKPGAGGAGRTVELTAGDDMKFSVTEITAKRGEALKVVLKNVGTLPKMAMGHNFVVVKPTTKLPEFSQAGAMARDTDFIPPAMKGEVVAATALTGPGETVEVSFKVPAAAGTYPFLCTFPGHFTAGMKGTIVVQ